MTNPEFYKRLGSYFFIIGALLAIFAGVFPVGEIAFNGIMVAIIFLGVFAAILNVDGDQTRFVIAGAGFLIMILCAEVLLGENVLIQHLVRFFQIATLFIGSMLATVTLSIIADFGSQARAHEEDVVDRVEKLTYTEAEKAWHFVVFVAVSLSFITVLLELFFALEQYAYAFFIFDIVITAVFFIDLVVLYKRAGSFVRFLQTSWLDIIATIPFYQVLRVAKVVRLIRLVEFLKLNKTLKFFSERSGVRHYLQPSGSSTANMSTPSEAVTQTAVTSQTAVAQSPIVAPKQKPRAPPKRR